MIPERGHRVVPLLALLLLSPSARAQTTVEWIVLSGAPHPMWGSAATYALLAALVLLGAVWLAKRRRPRGMRRLGARA